MIAVVSNITVILAVVGCILFSSRVCTILAFGPFPHQPATASQPVLMAIW